RRSRPCGTPRSASRAATLPRSTSAGCRPSRCPTGFRARGCRFLCSWRGARSTRRPCCAPGTPTRGPRTGTAAARRCEMAGDLPLFLVSAGVYLERDGKILILERAAGAMIGFWSLPSGLLDAGELPEDGARRELYEEAGLRPAGPLTLIAVTGFHVYGHDA